MASFSPHFSLCIRCMIFRPKFPQYSSITYTLCMALCLMHYKYKKHSRCLLLMHRFYDIRCGKPILCYCRVWQSIRDRRHLAFASISPPHLIAIQVENTQHSYRPEATNMERRTYNIINSKQIFSAASIKYGIDLISEHTLISGHPPFYGKKKKLY